jgi:hypothetical protein
VKETIMTQKPFRWTKRARAFRRLLQALDAPEDPMEVWEQYLIVARGALERAGARPSEIAMSLMADRRLFDQVVRLLGRS